MDLGELVRVIYSAVGANETTELEWKREWDFDSRPKRAQLAKHIVGFANRDPDRSAKVFAGHAFLLIGVGPAAIGSAPELDPAEIVQALTPYVGSELSWHPVYVDLGGARVLVLVVDPPLWGDPIHRLRRGSLDEGGRQLTAGTAYVRLPGTTVPADEDALKRLEARASVPRPRLAVAVDWNIGTSGNYVGVKVHNSPDGRPATIEEVGFTMAGTADASRLEGEQYPDGFPENSLAYPAFPIVEHTSEVIQPAELKPFRLPLGRLPIFWDETSELYPYIFYDGGKWLVGEPKCLVKALIENGWSQAADGPELFSILKLDFVWPESVAGHQGRFSLLSNRDS